MVEKHFEGLPDHPCKKRCFSTNVSPAMNLKTALMLCIGLFCPDMTAEDESYNWDHFRTCSWCKMSVSLKQVGWLEPWLLFVLSSLRMGAAHDYYTLITLLCNNYRRYSYRQLSSNCLSVVSCGLKRDLDSSSPLKSIMADEVFHNLSSHWHWHIRTRRSEYLTAKSISCRVSVSLDMCCFVQCKDSVGSVQKTHAS